MSTKIPFRPLGKNGPQIAALALGLMGFHYSTSRVKAFYGAPPVDEERLKFLDRAHEFGCTHWDSAQMYGDDEELIGKWFQKMGKREVIFLATKFENHVTPEAAGELKMIPILFVDTLSEIADKKNCTPGQLTLAWMIEQGDDIFPIPGTKNTKYLEENLDVYNVRLAPEETKAIKNAIERAEVFGTLYAEAHRQCFVVDTPCTQK